MHIKYHVHYGHKKYLIAFKPGTSTMYCLGSTTRILINNKTFI